MQQFSLEPTAASINKLNFLIEPILSNYGELQFKYPALLLVLISLKAFNRTGHRITI